MAVGTSIRLGPVNEHGLPFHGPGCRTFSPHRLPFHSPSKTYGKEGEVHPAVDIDQPAFSASLPVLTFQPTPGTEHGSAVESRQSHRFALGGCYSSGEDLIPLTSHEPPYSAVRFASLATSIDPLSSIRKWHA